jgi:hypothetical protein
MSFEAIYFIYCGKSWNIGQVRFECLMFMIMNFVALINNLLRKTCTAVFLFKAISFPEHARSQVKGHP